MPAEQNGAAAAAAAVLNAASAGKAPVKETSSFEASLIDSVEIDLGDF